MNLKLSNSKITEDTLPPHKFIKHFFLGILALDHDPAFDSEVATWLDKNNLIHIYAYIHPEEETWQHRLFNLINTQEFAPFISSIEIKGPNKGTNGTRLYDLSELLKDPNIQFTQLTEFEIEQTQSFHDHITMITYDDYYDDNGAGGKILDKMPNLAHLILPSAPSPSFFNRSFHPLSYISVQAGYDHQGFICRLAHSNCFPNLTHLEWTDGPGLPRITSCVPYDHFEKLKLSKQNLQDLRLNTFQIEPEHITE